MLKRTLGLCTLLLIPTIAQAQAIAQPAQAPPALAIRLASLDALFERLDVVGGLMGQDDLAKKLGASLASKLGAKGLFGIDGKRPIGLYARVGADFSDINGILMVPLTDAKQFKEMLEGLGWQVSLDNNGIHNVKQDLLPIDVQYRVANGYAYVGLQGMSTLTAEALLTPDAVFGPKPLSAAVSLTVRLDQIPEALAVMFLEAFKEGVAKIDQQVGATKAQKALCAALSKETIGILDSVLKEGEEITVQFDIEPKTKQMAVDLTLTPRAETKLADNIARLGQRQTLFAGVLDKDAALNGLMNIDLPAELRSALTAVLLESIDKSLTEGMDKGRKKKIALLLGALKPSLLAADLDAAVSVRGPNQDQKYLTVVGFKVDQGKKIAATLIQLVNFLPEREGKAIKLNAAEVDGVPVHHIALEPPADGSLKEFCGDVFVAFRDDAVFLAIGDGALEALTKALRTPPAPAAPLEFDAAVRLGVNSNHPSTAVSGLSPQGEGACSRLRFNLEGGAKLRLRLTMDLAAFKLFPVDKNR